jgi:hypothetical protein
MNVQHSSDPTCQWVAPGCSNGYKEWCAQSPQYSAIHRLRTSEGHFDSTTTKHPSSADHSRLRTGNDQRSSSQRPRADLHCGEPGQLFLAASQSSCSHAPRVQLRRLLHRSRRGRIVQTFVLAYRTSSVQRVIRFPQIFCTP